jgi:hypothetical protein
MGSLYVNGLEPRCKQRRQSLPLNRERQKYLQRMGMVIVSAKREDRITPFGEFCQNCLLQLANRHVKNRKKRARASTAATAFRQNAGSPLF